MSFSNSIHINSLKDIIRDQEEVIKSNISDEGIKTLVFGWQRKVFQMLLEKQKNELEMIEWKKQQTLNQERVFAEAEQRYSEEIIGLKNNLENERKVVKDLKQIKNVSLNKINLCKEELNNFKFQVTKKIASINRNFDTKVEEIYDKCEKLINNFKRFNERNKLKISKDSKEINKFKDIIKEKEDELTSITQKSSKLLEEREETSKKLLQLEAEYKSLKNEHKRQNGTQNEEIERLKEELEKESQEKNKLSKLLETEKTEHKIIENEFDEYKKKYKIFSEENTKTNKELTEKCNNLFDENNKYKEIIKSLEKQLESIKDLHNKEISDLEIENRTQIKDKESKLKYLKVERDSLLQKVNELKRMKIKEPTTKVDQGIMVNIVVEEVKEAISEKKIRKNIDIESPKEYMPEREETNSDDGDNLRESLPSERLMKKLEGIELAAK